MGDDGFIKLRQPCPCGCPTGRIKRVSGQDVVRCADCDKYLYCAPRSETGQPAEPLRPIMIKSKFVGLCKGCQAPHEPGDTVAWIPKTKGVWCTQCHARGAVA